MIITQTPFRMSFFGGGTDMESFFRENGGAVLSTTFDKYCYVNVRHLPRFFDYSTELSYSKTERVTCIEDIQHPAIRNAMKMLDIILHESGAFVTQTALGFDGEATRKMSAFLQDPKPELLHHQKFFENGTAERAKESGTEQNYNMIDGCVNNVPKKPRRIGGRWSVLDRLHIKQAERRQKDNAPQQEQERSRKS